MSSYQEENLWCRVPGLLEANAPQTLAKREQTRRADDNKQRPQPPRLHTRRRVERVLSYPVVRHALT